MKEKCQNSCLHKTSIGGQAVIEGVMMKKKKKIFVAGKNIGYCKGCYACKDTGVCVIKDDMAEVLQKNG